MSRCFYVTFDEEVDFSGWDISKIKKIVQDAFQNGTVVDAVSIENGYGARFSCRGESIRGVEVCQMAADEIEVRLPVLSNYADYYLGSMLVAFFYKIEGAAVCDEDDNAFDVVHYFSYDNISKMIGEDAKTFLAFLSSSEKFPIEIPAIKRSMFFGAEAKAELTRLAGYPDVLAERLLQMTKDRQYWLPDYPLPHKVLICPKGVKNPERKDMKKVLYVREGGDYILQDYDYLLLRGKSGKEGPVVITKEDLREILPRSWRFYDEYVAIAPKLPITEWRYFVREAAEFHHAELLG